MSGTKMTTQSENPHDEAMALIQLWNWNLSHHEVTDHGQKLIEIVREKYLELAQAIITNVPMGRELNLALTDLQKSQHSAVLAIVLKHTEDGHHVNRVEIRTDGPVEGEIVDAPTDK